LLLIGASTRGAISKIVGVVNKADSELGGLIGANIRRLRLEKGLTQEQFGFHVGLDRTYIGQLERGERNLSLQTVEGLAELLGVEPFHLLRPVDGTEAIRLAAAQGDVDLDPDRTGELHAADAEPSADIGVRGAGPVERKARPNPE
jgi:transcriptional regulator with XRE-family HTH domain